MTGRSGLGGYKGFTHPQWIGRLPRGVPDLKGWATSGLWDRNPVAEREYHVQVRSASVPESFILH